MGRNNSVGVGEVQPLKVVDTVEWLAGMMDTEIAPKLKPGVQIMLILAAPGTGSPPIAIGNLELKDAKTAIEFMCDEGQFDTVTVRKAGETDPKVVTDVEPKVG